MLRHRAAVVLATRRATVEPPLRRRSFRATIVRSIVTLFFVCLCAVAVGRSVESGDDDADGMDDAHEVSRSGVFGVFVWWRECENGL